MFSQNQFKALVKEHDSDELLAGVNVSLLNTQLGGATDESGLVEIRNIPDGTYEIRFSFIGYKDEFITIPFPLSEDKIFEIELEPEAEELEEISISSTRSSRLIINEPTRVEVIAGEEVDEKITMDPSSISMILNESTGIQVQQTSAASANNSFRIQGLEGRYTQLLKDGFPLYSGFSGSLSIVQVPPLDLKQVEIIKGSSSTLYGGGAIAGLINLISKEPNISGELSFLVNGTSAGGIDLSGYYSNIFDKTGIIFLASRNTQSAFDNNKDKFSDLPEIERYTLSPKLYFYLDDKNSLELGGTFVTEERTGGAIPIINDAFDSVYTFTEINKSNRFSSQIRYDHLITTNSRFTIKNSIGYFNRDLFLPSYSFSGSQLSSFSEAVFISSEEKFEWILGLNLITENFKDESIINSKRDYFDLTLGTFTQFTVDISETHSSEAGLRLDYEKKYNFFLLPRISFLSKWNNHITTRIGGGLGYKIPTIFAESSEEISFRNVLPIDKQKVNAEKSLGFNFDINYNSILFDEITFTLNNLIFYTRIDNPLILIPNSLNTNLLEFTSFEGHYDTQGLETNLKLTYDHLKLFAGYTFTNVESHNSTRQELPLTPKHKLGLVLIFEEHENYRIGFEAYYTGNQKLSTGKTTNDYWINGLMIEKHFQNISLFLNFENFLDTRQSKYGPMFTGLPSNPDFVELYAPTDGRIINAGIKIKL
ncbi:MAG TPA: TonB-dependent receptor [Ignavibacteriaceae bacterium]|nr:TonB-dependent receptor [Ignavibacteriaceae bacterium]